LGSPSSYLGLAGVPTTRSPQSGEDRTSQKCPDGQEGGDGEAHGAGPYLAGRSAGKRKEKPAPGGRGGWEEGGGRRAGGVAGGVSIAIASAIAVSNGPPKGERRLVPIT